MATWHSLYWTSNPTSPAVETREAQQRVERYLAEHDYTHYHPFGGLPAPLFSETIKLFVSPLRAGWGRLICATAPPDDLAAGLSAGAVVLAASLADNRAQVNTWVDGEPATPAAALQAHLRVGASSSDLQTALAALGADHPATPQHNIPLEALPEDYRKMAEQLNPRAINRLFERLVGQALPNADDRDAAADIVRQAAPLNWGAGPAATLRRVWACLTLPENCHQPSFNSLRDAYSLHARRQRKPDARLYPGDADAMRAVPDALRYTPIFAGKDI